MTRDYLDESTADRWTDAELRRYVNQGVQFIQSQIHQASESYFLRVETATADAGAYELAFPSDIWGNKLRSFQYYLNSTVATGIPARVSPGQLEWVYENLYYSGTPQNYALHAGFLRWAPMLEKMGTFRFVYSMKETPWSTDGSADAVTLGQIADEHTDVIALYAAIMAENRIGADSRPLSETFKVRMRQILHDIQPSDPVVIPQVRID
jgi:hypothetical protein